MALVTGPASRTHYDHRDEGTPEATWSACPEWAGVGDGANLLQGVSRVLVLSAHPDDETFAVGGLTALAHRLGLTVHLVLATDGEASHPNSPTVTPEGLAHLRTTEYDAALELLTPGAPRVRLGLPDGALARHRPALEHAIGVALRVAPTSSGDETVPPGKLLLVAPWRGDGHPDHEAAGEAAVAAAAAHDVLVAEYPLWLWHWGAPKDVPWDRAWALRLPEELRDRKAAAIRAHRSQVEPLSPAPGDEAILHPGTLAYFARPFEVLFAARP